jgi:hypothetical protein
MPIHAAPIMDNSTQAVQRLTAVQRNERRARGPGGDSRQVREYLESFDLFADIVPTSIDHIQKNLARALRRRTTSFECNIPGVFLRSMRFTACTVTNIRGLIAP